MDNFSATSGLRFSDTHCFVLQQAATMKPLYAAHQGSKPSQQVDLAATLWSLSTHCEGKVLVEPVILQGLPWGRPRTRKRKFGSVHFSHLVSKSCKGRPRATTSKTQQQAYLLRLLSGGRKTPTRTTRTVTSETNWVQISALRNHPCGHPAGQHFTS